MLKTAKT